MTDDLGVAAGPRGPRMPDQRRDTPGAPPRGTASPLAGRVLPRGVAQVRPEAPAAVLMVDLGSRQVLYANEVAAQLAPGLSLPVSADEWSATADLRDDGRVRLLQAPDSDLLLGVDPPTVRQLNESTLPVGAVLLMYTDGPVERRTQPLAEGIELLRSAAAAAAGDDGEVDLDLVVEEVLDRMLPSPSADDVALVAVRIC